MYSTFPERTMDYNAFFAEAEERGLVAKRTHRLRPAASRDPLSNPIATPCNPRAVFQLVQLLARFGNQTKTLAAQEKMLAMVAERDDLGNTRDCVVWITADGHSAGMALPRNPVTMREWLRTNGYEYWLNRPIE